MSTWKGYDATACHFVVTIINTYKNTHVSQLETRFPQKMRDDATAYRVVVAENYRNIEFVLKFSEIC